MRIAVLQNHAAEGPARIQDWADRKEFTLDILFGYDGEFPSPTEYDGLIIMGGPNSVHDADTNSNIAGAIDSVGEFLDAGKPVLGICLGAQMMSIASGGEVVPGTQKEIGWYPLTIPQGEPTNLSAGLPDQLTVCHWHGEQIIPPAGALVFAATPNCPVQALQLAPNQLALQYHLEVSPESLQRMATEFSDELSEGGPGVQAAEEVLAGYRDHCNPCFQHLCELLDRIFV